MDKSSVRPPAQKYEFVLGAGGVEGPAHIGVLRCLEERQVPLGKITGASVGALIATFIANGYNSKQLQEIFLSESFRYPSWDLWSKCIRMPDPSNLFFPWTFDQSTWMNYFIKNAWPWVVDFKPWLTHVVNEYGLKPQDNLRLVAADALTRKPVVFQGCDYDLVDGLTASTAAISGLGMRPLWIPPNGNHRDGHDDCESVGGHLLIDGFYFHPIPATLCETKPAIVSKIGFATQLPNERLSPWDFAMHLREMMLAVQFDAMFPDPPGHIIIESGMRNVASTNFGVSLRTLETLIDHAYKAANEKLARELP